MLRPSMLLLIATAVVSASFEAKAADLGLTSFKSLEHDLGRPFLWKKQAGDLNLGLDFSEHRSFDFDSQALSNTNESQDLGAEAAVRLPLGLETGLSLKKQSAKHEGIGQGSDQTSAESQTIQVAPAFTFWLRWHLLESASLRSSLGIQTEAGVKDNKSFHQTSQPRYSVFASQEWSPLSWLHGGAFVGKSWRSYESFGDWRLGDEISFGGRLTLGPPALHSFAEAAGRQLVVKYKDQEPCQQEGNLWRVGLGSQLGAFDARASFLLGQQKSLFGLPREGYMLALHYSMLSASPSSTLIAAKPKKAIAASKKEPAAKAVAASDQPKAPLEDPSERDEFQLFEEHQAKEAENQNQPVPSEIAERELKALREAAAEKQAAEKEKEQERQKDYEQAVREEVREDQNVIEKYKDDINEELNQYSLPDSEEVNWNGLP